MYFGRSIDEIAPQYAYNTFRNLGARKEHMFATRKKYEDFQAEYDKLPEKEQFLKHAELTKLRKEANDAMLDVATLVGGLIVAEDMKAVSTSIWKNSGSPKSSGRLRIDGRKFSWIWMTPPLP